MLDEQKKQERLIRLKSVAQHRKPAAAKTSFSKSVEETVHCTVQIDDVPLPSTSQFVEYTLTPQMERKNKRRDSSRVAEVTMHYDVQTYGDSVKLIRRQSSTMLSREVTSAEKVDIHSRRQRDSVGIPYEVTDRTTVNKYSHVERMSVVRKFYR